MKHRKENTLQANPILKIVLLIPVCALLVACSGVHITPDETSTFVAADYDRYAWRSEPPTQSAGSRDLTARKSPLIREGVNERLAELGYSQVARDDAQFLIEYVAAAGLSDGQLSRGGSNDTLYGSSVNRQIDGAAADNAYTLSGPVETGEIRLVFIDANSTDVLWRVKISVVVEDSNRIDEGLIRDAVRRGISALPPAS